MRDGGKREYSAHEQAGCLHCLGLSASQLQAPAVLVHIIE